MIKTHDDHRNASGEAVHAGATDSSAPVKKHSESRSCSVDTQVAPESNVQKAVRLRCAALAKHAPWRRSARPADRAASRLLSLPSTSTRKRGLEVEFKQVTSRPCGDRPAKCFGTMTTTSVFRSSTFSASNSRGSRALSPVETTSPSQSLSSQSTSIRLRWRKSSPWPRGFASGEPT